MHTADDHLVGGLSHDRPCCYCGHAVHVLRCGAEVVDGVFCPCRDVPVPGAHRQEETDVPDWTVRRRGTDSSGRGVYASDYMWDWWLGVCDELGFTPTITQGAWMTMAGGGADDSAGYHDGGGCFDLRVWDRSEEQVTRMIHVLRSNGAAAWLRNPQHGGFTDPHVHFVLGTDHDLDSGAAWQWREYIAGRDGLASEGPDYHWRPSPLVLIPPKEDDMQEADFERLQQMMDKAADRIAKAVVQGLLAADLFPKREDIDRTVREALRTASAPPKDKGKS